MRKHILTAALSLLFAITAMAQQFPYRKLYPDSQRPGMLLDSVQIRLLKTREDYTTKEIERIRDSIRGMQWQIKNLSAVLSTGLPTQFSNTITVSTGTSNLTSTKSSNLISTRGSGPRTASSATPLTSNPSTSLGNACGVKASFTPANDTTLYTGQAISFTNTSQNADSYTWFNDVYNQSATTDFTNFVPAVGITPIMLVARRGTCTDTAITYVVRNGTPPTDPKRMYTSYGLPNSNEFVSCMTNAKADGYLLAGVSGDYDQNGYLEPYFVRVSESGCILWSKLLPVYGKIVLHSLITTYDSGFLLQVVQRDDIENSYLLKLDKNGNFLWAHSYQGANSLNYAHAIKEMADHSLMVLSGQWSGQNFLLTKLDPQGAFLWQKKYLIKAPDYASFYDLVEQNGSAWVAGTYYELIDAPTNQWKEFPMLFKIDAATGNLLWSKGYASPNKYYGCTGIHFYKDGLILNGYADSLVVPYNNEWSNFETLLETDLDGNIREGTLIYQAMDVNIPIGENLFVNADNTISLFYSGTEILSLQPGYANLSFYIRLDAAKQIIWQQEYLGYTAGWLAQASPAPLKGLAMIGQRMTSLSNPNYGFSENLILAKVDSNGTAADPFCDVYTSQSVMQDLAVTPYSPGAPVVSDENLQVVNKFVNLIQPNSELRYHCPDYVPLCSFMKLSGKHDVCNMKDTLEFIAHKDPSCGDPVTWTYDLTNIKTVYQDGGRVRLLFKAPGIYTILAEKPFPCTSIRDSIIVTVAQALIDLRLGNDTTLCSGDSLLLMPSGKYNQYLWQDGSTGDSLMVKTAGIYHVMVTDSCGNQKADTIQVDFKTSITLNLGGPLMKCPADSLIITPPAGFHDYLWTPAYHLLNSPGGLVVLFPDKDTVYEVRALDAGGCPGFGELKVNVYKTKTVRLGNDTTICAGGHAVFSATGNFVSWAWSDGESSNTIDVQAAGKYIVMAKDQNNCVSADSVLLMVYPKPDVHISGGTAICKDQSLVLDAGDGFVIYLWQDGSGSQRFNATDTGFYRVAVTDAHQCVAADSIHITAYADSPQSFLPADTTICNYGDALIQPKGDFAQYSWSTGETGSSIRVETAGEYILQVVDGLGCRGVDSIRIEVKNCDALLVFPNAFTPNQDGLNDVFRLKYPGFVADYQLQIFNRWGQLVYRSADPFGAWDGRFDGQIQPSGTYVWIARFTDRSGKKLTMQGSVVLIK